MTSLNKLGSSIETVGAELLRPECVLTNARGDIFVSDFRGGVTRIAADGTQSFHGGAYEDYGVLQTNGFALLEDGSFLIAHLGAEHGGVFRIGPDNEISAWLTEIDGRPLPPTNFVYLDHQGRIWITVSTRTTPRAEAYRKSCDDGFIILVDARGARIVADGLGYTNEVWVNPDGSELFVNATFSRELIRYRIANDELLQPRVITRFSAGTFPDGLTRDCAGNLWVTSIVSNRVIRVDRDGNCETLVEDSDDAHLEAVERAYQADAMGRSELDRNPAQTLRNISSLAFFDGGILLGCLLGQQVYLIRAAVNGVKPAHWFF